MTHSIDPAQAIEFLKRASARAYTVTRLHEIMERTKLLTDEESNEASRRARDAREASYLAAKYDPSERMGDLYFAWRDKLRQSYIEVIREKYNLEAA